MAKRTILAVHVQRFKKCNGLFLLGVLDRPFWLKDIYHTMALCIQFRTLILELYFVRLQGFARWQFGRFRILTPYIVRAYIFFVLEIVASQIEASVLVWSICYLMLNHHFVQNNSVERFEINIKIFFKYNVVN